MESLSLSLSKLGHMWDKQMQMVIHAYATKANVNYSAWLYFGGAIFDINLYLDSFTACAAPKRCIQCTKHHRVRLQWIIILSSSHMQNASQSKEYKPLLFSYIFSLVFWYCLLLSFFCRGLSFNPAIGVLLFWGQYPFVRNLGWSCSDLDW